MEIPSTRQLRQMAPLNLEAELGVLTKAHEISQAIESPREKTIAVIGPCAMTNHPVELLLEGQSIDELNDGQLVTVQRMPVWKPRTDPEKDWEGLETALVEIREGKGYGIPATEGLGLSAAYRILSAAATQHRGSAIEVANSQHIDRYDPLLSFAWSGSRSIGKREQILALAKRDPKLPLGIKNGMSGDITEALEVIASVEQARRPSIAEESPAPSVLIFRGGKQLDTPEKWERGYLDAISQTEGRVIVDVAHGSEMAHDPNGRFRKSVAGQVAAMESVIRLAEHGYIPAGMMIEATNLQTPTDPVMPLDLALTGVKRLHKIKHEILASNRV